MRIAEARGEFDTYCGTGERGRFRVSTIEQTHNPWAEQGKKLLNLDEARKFRLSIDALGRVASIISQAEEPENYPAARRVL
jgi:hypothetical protein